MEALSRVVRQSLPRYFESIPIPDSFSGFLTLSGGEWFRLMPFVGTVGLLVYTIVQAFRPRENFVNKKVQKDSPKVVNLIDVEDLGEKTCYCRCWKSNKFPICDGSHNNHNKETGDNVGPLVVKKGSN